MPEQLHRQDFAACLHTRFRVLEDDAAAGKTVCELELIEVSEEERTAQQEMFSVVFHGPNGRFLSQHTYRLRHECLGEQHLFLVPIGQDAEGFQYQAVFNRVSAGPVGPRA